MQTASLLTQPRDLMPGNSFYEHELPILVQRIKNDCGWKTGDLKSMVVINNDKKKVLLTALHPSTEIESNQTGNFIVFQVLQGSIKISIKKQTLTLVSGQKFTLYDRTKYKLQSITEAIFLLIISPLEAK